MIQKITVVGILRDIQVYLNEFIGNLSSDHHYEQLYFRDQFLYENRKNWS